MEDAAIKWAQAAYPSILSVAASKLTKVVQPMLELPEFIERKEGEPHLSVRTTEDSQQPQRRARHTAGASWPASGGLG